MKAASVATLLLVAAATRAAAAGPVDDATVQAAIDRELAGVRRDGQLEVDVHEDGTATLTYTRPDGSRLARQVILPPRNEDAVELLALLAGNLVRDQARDVLADLTLVAPAPHLYPRRSVSFGFFPPLSTDLLYGEPVVATFSLNALVGLAPGMRGVSITGLVDVQTEDSVGLQIAGGSDVVLGDLDGFQISGSANLTTGVLTGGQISGGLNVARQTRGVQIGGLVNVTGTLAGVQIAPVNVAMRSRGVQLGVVNYSDRSDGVPIGLISIVRHGLTELDVWAESTRTAHLTLRHGTRHFYNLYGIAAGAPGDDSIQMFGLGFGGRVYRGPVDVDLAGMTWSVGGSGIDAGLSILNQARLTVALPLGHLAVFAGAALDVYVADSGENGDALHPALDRSWVNGDTTTRMWPAFFAGLRVR